MNKQQLVASVGYSEKVADKKSTEILESKGVQEELAILGFDVETAKRVVGQIALEGENDNVKLKASEMIFKVHGTFAAEKHVNLNINRTEDSKLDALIAQIEDGLDQLEGTA